MIKYSLVLVIISLNVLFAQDIAFFEDHNTSSFLVPEDCDACGCSATGGSFGFGDLQQKNKITLRYLNQNYRSKETIFNNSPWSEEHFGTIQMLGLFSIAKNLKILSIIPYQFLSKETSTTNINVSGLGDISVISIYNILNKEINKKNKINWLFGAGVKLPTGTFNENFGGSLNPGFQLGTGSLDYSLLTEFSFNSNNWGWQHTLNYLYKNTNKFDFKFGNQWNYFTNIYKKIIIQNSQIIPMLGYAYEFSYENVDFGVLQPNTQARAHLLKIGVDYSFNSFLVGFHYFQPISQNLFNETVELSNRFNLSLQYLL